MVYWLQEIVIFIALGGVAFLVSLGGGIVLHELGHLIAMKLLGLKVSEFAIGTGTTVLKGTIKEVDVSLHLNPFGGGHVVLPDEELERYSEKGNHSIWIPASGPLANLIMLLLSFIVLSSTPALIGAALAQVLILLCAFSVEEEAPYSDGQHMVSIMKTGSFKITGEIK